MESRYLKSFTLVIVVILLLVGSFNLAVDPFDMFSTPRIIGFNAEKTEFRKYTRMAKAHAVRTYFPRGLILGTSRAEYGLDPQHSAWAATAKPVYNLALSSGRIEEAYWYLQHAYVHGDLQQVVLAADFFMFDAHNRFEAGFDRARLNRPDGKKMVAGWTSDIMNTLFSMDALVASIDTIRAQGSVQSILYRPDGMRRSNLTWQQIKTKGGYREAFLADTRHDLRARTGWPLFTLSEIDDVSSPTLDIFSELVRFCLEHGIELKVIISPIHARKLETLYLLGLWDLFEYWKLRMTNIVEIENRRMVKATPAVLWDFSGYNAITTEPVPHKDNPDVRMHWYWEGSHYRRELGNKILGCVLGEGQPEACSLGHHLTTDNIGEHLIGIRSAGDRYRASHPEDIRELIQLIRETATEREHLRKQAGWRIPRPDASGLLQQKAKGSE